MNTPLSSLLSRPLALSEIGATHLRSIASNPQHYARFEIASKETAGRMPYDYLGNKVPAPYDMEGGVRVIPLQGPITRGLGMLGQFFGMADTDEFREWVEAAGEDERVSKIVLHIQSPGGDAIGCYEAAEAVVRAAKKKPVVAYCDDMMASAAYFIGAGANVIISTPSALIGSIGTYVVLADDSEAWKRMGVEFRVIRSGKFKGAGIDGYTPEQIENIQSMVDAFGAQFRAFVKKQRTEINDEDLEGQVFLGSEAQNRDFTDGVANSLENALAVSRKLIQKANS